MTTPVGSSEAAPRPPQGPRPRGLVPSEPDLPRRAPATPPPYAVSIGKAPRLPRRPWRATKTAVAVVLLLAIALFAAVQAVRTFADVIDDGESNALDAYAEGDRGVDVAVADRFTVVMPDDPDRVSVPVPGDSEGRVASALVTEVQNAEFVISWFDLEAEVTDPGAVLSLLAAATVEQRGGVIEDRGMQLTGALPAHEFVVERDDGFDHVHNVLVGRSVYQLRVSAPGPRGAAFTRFVESFAPVIAQ